MMIFFTKIIFQDSWGSHLLWIALLEINSVYSLGCAISESGEFLKILITLDNSFALNIWSRIKSRISGESRGARETDSVNKNFLRPPTTPQIRADVNINSRYRKWLMIVFAFDFEVYPIILIHIIFESSWEVVWMIVGIRFGFLCSIFV